MSLTSIVLVIIGAYIVISLLAKSKAQSETREFFSEEQIRISMVRGFLRGLKVNPIEEEEAIKKCKVNSDYISRKELIKWVINFLEKQKEGSGRKFLEMTGFKSLSEL